MKANFRAAAVVISVTAGPAALALGDDPVAVPAKGATAKDPQDQAKLTYNVAVDDVRTRKPSNTGPRRFSRSIASPRLKRPISISSPPTGPRLASCWTR